MVLPQRLRGQPTVESRTAAVKTFRWIAFHMGCGFSKVYPFQGGGVFMVVRSAAEGSTGPASAASNAANRSSSSG